jgi:putative FmdB family regulatory protein
MPLYEYECESCGRRFERIQKFSDPLVTACPHCGGVVRKLFSSPAIQFKGSGFYITDYAKAGQSADDSGAAKPAAGDSASAGSKDAAGNTDAAASTSKSEPAGESASKTAESKSDSGTKTVGKAKE